MKNTKTITIIKAKTLLSLFVIAPMLVLSACEQESNHNKLSVSDDTLSAPIPHAILTATTENLDIAVRIDGGSPQTCANLIVDESAGTYSCNLTVPQGSHTLSLDYSINDTTRGLVPVALTSTININVTSNQVTSVEFGDFNTTYIDIDNDGIRNLDELINGSDPFDIGDPTFRVLNFSDTGQSVGSPDGGGIASGAGDGLALGDVDGDGDLDMVTGNGNRDGQSVYINNGNGVYTDTGQTLGPTNFLSSTLGDIDGDGDLDLVVGNFESMTFDGANHVYINNGSGVYTDTGQSLGSSSSHSVALGDVDGDGDLDLVVANDTNEANRVYTNNGDGVYTDTGQTLGTNNSRSVALGDVDGDGDLDMVVGNSNSIGANSNRVYTNNGNGIFTDTGQTLGSRDSRSVALGDVDGDGDLDMVVGNSLVVGDSSSNEVDRVYTNNGSGIFTDTGQSLGPTQTKAIALGDLDGDGDLDLVVGNSNGNLAYANDGSGMYTDTSQSPGVNCHFIILGDVDGDGDLDVVSSENGIGIHVFLND